MLNSELRIIKKAKKGSPRAQKKLYEAYYNYVFVICLKYLKNREKAEDIAQDVFFKALTNITSFNEEKYSNLKPWLQSITVNTCINSIKRKKAELFESEEQEKKFEAQDDSFSQKEFTNDELRYALPRNYTT